MDESELKLAVESNIIHPDMKRVTFEKWRNKQREKDQNAPAVQLPPPTGAEGAILDAVLPSRIGADSHGELPLDLPATETPTSHRSSASGAVYGAEVPSPTTAPVDHESLPADGPYPHTLSADEQREYEDMFAAFKEARTSVQEQFLLAAYKAVPEVVQQQLKAMLLLFDTTSTAAAN